MNSDLMSQDDIDSLIQPPEGSGPGAGAAARTPAGTAADAEGLKGPLLVITEQISTVLATVLGKEIHAETGKTGPADRVKVTQDFGAQSLLLKVDLSDRITGPLFFVFTKSDSAMLADLMMMGDGSAQYADDHKEALVELVHQMMGAVASTFATQFDARISSTTPTVEDFDAGGKAVDLANVLTVEVGLKIEGVRDTRFLILLPPATAGELTDVAGAAGAGAAAGAAGADGGIDLTGLDTAAAGLTLENFGQPGGKIANDKAAQFSSTGNPQMDMLLDVTLQVAIELGRTEMSIKKILELGPGAIIELDRMAGEPVDLLVNDKVIAKGEVVVVDENFGIRIIKLVSPEERLKNLK